MENKKGMAYPILKLIAIVIGVVVLVLAVANIGSLSEKLMSLIQRFTEMLRYR